MKIVTNNDFDCYDVAEMSGIKRGITIDGKTLEEIKSEAIKDFAEEYETSIYGRCKYSPKHCQRNLPCVICYANKYIEELMKQ